MRWFELLFDYGMPDDVAAADPNDPDTDLIPTLAAKASRVS